jgi:maltose O-acetyltransferase
MTLLRSILKLIMPLVRDSSYFSLTPLRPIRNILFRLLLRENNIQNVGVGADIRSAHHSPDSKFECGPGLCVGERALIDFTGGLILGDGVTISEGAHIYTHNHRIDGLADWRKNGITYSSLELGDYAWIGANSIILESVRSIGTGAVVAAGAILTKDVGDYEVWGGSPAKLLRKRTITDS